MKLHERHKVKLADIASIERAKPGRTYPAGTTLIQISATNGQTRYLDEPSEAEPKYAAITPTSAKIWPRYLYFIIERELPRFRHAYQTTLNIQLEAFNHMTLDVHDDIDTQHMIVGLFAQVDERIGQEAQTIQRLKDLKAWHMATMFAQPG